MEISFDNSSSCGGDIWLSPQALTAESPPIPSAVQPLFPVKFPYERSLSSESSFSSPVESLTSPDETESEDDDDYVAGLAERIAHSMLDEDEEATDGKFELENTNLEFEQRGLWASDATKVCLDASLPRLTVPGRSWLTRSWSSCSAGSSDGSSRVSSQVTSPSSTPMASQGDSWELLYAAAGEMLRLKMLEESKASASSFHLQSVKQQIPRCNQTQPGPWGTNYASVVHPTQLSSASPIDLVRRSSSFSSAVPVAGLSKDVSGASASRFQRSMSLSTEDVPKFQIPSPKPVPCYGSSAWSGGCRQQSRPITQSSRCGRSGPKVGCGQRARWSSDNSPPQWPHMQPTLGSGMRAVFLGSNASGRESPGTGVFLPRHGLDCRKKPSCSTVLLPTRIVQALNLNLEDVHSPPIGRSKSTQWTANGRDYISLPSSPSTSTSLFTATKTEGRDTWLDPDKKLMYSTCSPLQQETSLPTEWTY